MAAELVDFCEWELGFYISFNQFLFPGSAGNRYAGLTLCPRVRVVWGGGGGGPRGSKKKNWGEPGVGIFFFFFYFFLFSCRWEPVSAWAGVDFGAGWGGGGGGGGARPRGSKKKKFGGPGIRNFFSLFLIFSLILCSIRVGLSLDILHLARDLHR